MPTESETPRSLAPAPRVQDLQREVILPSADRGRLAAIVATCSLAGLAGGMALSMLAETQRAAHATRVPRPAAVHLDGPMTWLGVSVKDRDRHSCSGAWVREVTPGSPAARAGLQVDDVVIGFGGDLVCGSDHLVHVVRASSIGATPELVVERGAEQFVFHPSLAEMPDDIRDRVRRER